MDPLTGGLRRLPSNTAATSCPLSPDNTAETTETAKETPRPLIIEGEKMKKKDKY